MADPLWADVSVLCHFDGAQSSQTFTNAVSGGPSLTAQNSAQLDDTIDPLFGSNSVLLPESSEPPLNNGIALSPVPSGGLGTAFCIELAIYGETIGATPDPEDPPVGYGLFTTVESSSSNLQLAYYDAGDGPKLYVIYYASGWQTLASSGSLTLEAWHRIALDYDGTTLRLFADGSLAASAALSSANFADDDYWFVPGSVSGDDRFHVDELRITHASRRTAAYTVDTEPFEEVTVVAGVGEAAIAATAAAVGRSLPYGEAACAVTAAAVGARTQAAAAAAAITATAAGLGGALPDLDPLPITIDVKLRAEVGLPIVIDAWVAKTATLPISLGRYAVTPTLPITIDVWQAVEVGLPIVFDVWVAKTATLPISLGRYAVTPTLPITIDVWQAKTPTLPITIYGDLSDSAADALVIWRPKVVLDGTTISGLLIQAQDSEFEEDGSPIASLSFVPAAGAVDPLAWVGKTIALWWQRLVNNVVTAEILVYTGTVSDPEWDAVNRVLAISATGDMQAKFDRMSKTEIKATIGGTYSEYIFGDPDDLSGWEYAQALMSTQASTLWQDQSAAIRVTACAAKASADYTWTEDDLLEGTPVVRYAGRQDMTNTIYLSLGYRYAALRQRNVVFNFRPWQLEQPSMFLSGNLGGWELPQRSQIESAANGGGWVVIGSINYSDVWPNGLYSSYSDSGTPILEGLSLTPEYAADLCIGARWTAARRWKQSWTEQYALTVQASDSVAAVGTLATDESYSIEDPADDEEWESDEEFTGYKSGSTTMPNGLDRVYRLDTIRADVTEAQSVALAKAQAEILKSHRNTTVEVTLPFQPQLSLADTVEIDTAYLECKGKVRRIRHHWDIETGDCTTEVSIALSRHNGSGLVSGDALTPPSEPGDPDETEPDTYHNLEMHIGGQDDRPMWDEDWDGFVVNVPYSSSYGENTLLGSWSRNPANPALANRIYEEGFHIVAPTIDSEYADPLDFTDAAIYDVAVPEDPLVLISG